MLGQTLVHVLLFELYVFYKFFCNFQNFEFFFLQFAKRKVKICGFFIGFNIPYPQHKNTIEFDVLIQSVTVFLKYRQKFYGFMIFLFFIFILNRKNKTWATRKVNFEKILHVVEKNCISMNENYENIREISFPKPILLQEAEVLYIWENTNFNSRFEIFCFKIFPRTCKSQLIDCEKNVSK